MAFPPESYNARKTEYAMHTLFSCHLLSEIRSLIMYLQKFSQSALFSHGVSLRHLLPDLNPLQIILLLQGSSFGLFFHCHYLLYFTTTLTVVFLPLYVLSVILVFPFFLPVILPFSSTAAIFLLADLKVIFPLAEPFVSE